MIVTVMARGPQPPFLFSHWLDKLATQHASEDEGTKLPDQRRITAQIMRNWEQHKAIVDKPPSATVRLRGMGTCISEASKRVPSFSFATQVGKQVSFYFRQRNWVQAREAQIRFPAGWLTFDSID